MGRTRTSITLVAKDPAYDAMQRELMCRVMTVIHQLGAEKIWAAMQDDRVYTKGSGRLKRNTVSRLAGCTLVEVTRLIDAIREACPEWVWSYTGEEDEE